eukprot:CAMPEP_0177686864 /NCGR_PEP_ID=MMETSP0447-20121125/33804_1 /TAXON_ID=0 /ORGANISM="Stygamoeba regulata, Strain BSH-02190019" /LENGTH=71 /DNA_ID=CAMNT_0019197031 /DNA_START=36 /DNA_END=251 /DNA_ORIENTATION=+
MTYDDADKTFYYDCPCGDRFEFPLEDLFDGEEVAHCPSCTLIIRVLYTEEDIVRLEKREDGGGDSVAVEAC